MEKIELRVSANTDCSDLGWSIFRNFEEKKEVHLSGMGGEALSRMVRGAIEANKHLVARGVVLVLYPYYQDAELREEGKGRISKICFKLGAL